MKNILVLTDFSENAAAAAEAGLLLAGKLHTGLVLYNTYINYQTMASYGGGGWIVDEFSERKLRSKNSLEELTEGLESLADQLDQDDRMPTICFESDDNDLGMDVAELIGRKNIEMVVMGARSGTKDDIMFGADTNAAIEYSTRPVLITPAATNLRNLHRIIFATDFEKGDLNAVHYLVKLSKLFHYKIEIIHVCDPNAKDSHEREQRFRYHLDKINCTGLYYHDVNGKDVVNRLNRVVSEDGNTMVAMVHVQHSFIIRLFQHSMVRQALVHQKTPLLVFPSKMIDH